MSFKYGSSAQRAATAVLDAEYKNSTVEHSSARDLSLRVCKGLQSKKDMRRSVPC